MGDSDDKGTLNPRVRAEANILGENPVFALWSGTDHREGSPRQVSEVRWTWEQVREDGGSEVREIEIVGPRRFGIPSALDMDVLVALLAIREQNRDADRIYFRRREIGRLLGWRWGGRDDRAVMRSLERLHALSIWFKNSWQDKSGWDTIREGVHVLDGVKLFDRSRDGFARRGRPARDFNWVKLSDYMVRSIAEGHFAFIEMATYRALPPGLARRLYLYLMCKRGRGGDFAIGLRRLAQHMPLTCAKVTRLRESVERAATALAAAPRERPVLERPMQIERRGRGEFLLRFRVAPRRVRIRPPTPAEATGRHVTRFYEMVGVEPTQERLAQDLRVLSSLKEQGFTDEDLKYAVSYMLSRPKEWKNPRSLGLLPHVMPHAIKDKRQREEGERRRQADSIKRDAERLKAQRDRLYAERARELVRRKVAELSAERLAELRLEAAEFPSVKVMPRKFRDTELAYQVERLVLERCCSPEELAACEPQLARPD